MNTRKLSLFIQAAVLLGISFVSIKFYNLNKISKNLVSTKKNLKVFSNNNSNTVKTSLIPSKTKLTLTINKQEKTSKGFNLYPTSGTAEVLLVSMEGKIVHKWNVDAERARLLPNGNLLVIHGSKWGKDVSPWRELRDEIREYSWNGEIVWTHKAKDVAHHDLQRLNNGNTAYLRRSILPVEYKKKIKDINKRNLDIRADSVIEVDKNGNLAWQWNSYEHLDLNSCGRRPCREIDDPSMAHDKSQDWTHINTLSVLPENKFFTAGDTRFKPGNIIFLPRNFWTIYLIDKDSGNIVWEYGGDYKGGLSGGHEASMIPAGLPGAGNILVLDNGTKYHRGRSFILEIDPQTSKPVWIYDVGKKFFTETRGSVQRLSNGNTLISEDNTGRLFEVTVDKETVWELKSSQLSSRSRRYDLDYCPQFGELG